MSVTFETKCYEKDWKYVILTNRIEKLLDDCIYKFDKKKIIYK